MESVETLFLMDGRLAQTVPALMLYPGRVSRDYLNGRRARFIPPFRLYVLASLVFFVLMPLVTGQGGFTLPETPGIVMATSQLDEALEEGRISEEEHAEAVAGLERVEGMLPGNAGNADAADTSEDTSSAGTGTPAASDGSLNGIIPEEAMTALREAEARGDGDAAAIRRILDNPSRVGEETRRWIPRIMFVLLPVYALLLSLVYAWRRRFFYFDHLIVSLHFHAALFFAMSLGMLAAMLVGWGWVTLALLIYANAYLYKINRVVYGRGRFSSVLRVLTLDTIYGFILILALTTAFALGAISAAQ